MIDEDDDDDDDNDVSVGIGKSLSGKETQERKGDVRNSFTDHEIDKNQKYLQVIPRHNTRPPLAVSPYT